MVDSRALQIGVIGVGGRGGLAGLAHCPEDNVRLVAGADVNDNALAAFREQYGANTFTTHDYRELLARPEIDAVFVTSPDFLHEEHAVAALRAGKGVYLEKPMAITIEGCDNILRAAYETKSKLYLGHNMRHFAVLQRMKEIIDAGTIGEVKTAWCRHFICYGGDAYFKDWHADRTKSTGLLLQKGAHDIDILHWLCGGYTQRVTAMGALSVYGQITDRHDPSERGDATFRLENWPPLSQKQLNPVIDVEDISMMLMQLDNGVQASYQQCHFTPDAWRNYMVVGTEGRIENFGDSPGESVIRVWTNRSNYQPHGDVQYFVPNEGGSHGGADPKIVAEFVRYLREGGPIATSPIAARYSVAAGVQATKSLRSGSTPLDVPPLPEAWTAYFDAEVRGTSAVSV
ncbi:MAG TPA: Gfo/Idh/MocA family oxidoreductase [Armatimonadota bacterium]|jgi:predicted dehydrogenase